MIKNQLRIVWRVAWAGMVLLVSDAALAQTCNPSALSTFTSWSNGGSTIVDNATGLVWQRCAVGQSWTGSTCSGTASTATWATAVSGAPAGWRLPNVKELESMVERRCYTPAVDGSAFPGAPSVQFWSSTPGWAVNFNDGRVLNGLSAASAMAVRYVKGGASNAVSYTPGSTGSGQCTTQAPAEFKLTDWVENADGTLYDGGTGLTWDRCVQGQSWSAAAGGCTGTPEALTWSAALARADAAFFSGRTGWRVPNVKELESILDRRCSRPPLNPDFFRGNREALTWSSTPMWAVNFVDGSVRSGWDASTAMAVRLVRGGVKMAAYDVRTQDVPGAVLAGPATAGDETGNLLLTLPTGPNQSLIFLTHGWNADASAWPEIMLNVLCARLGATVTDGGLATPGQAGVAKYCAAGSWRVVSFNWKAMALDMPDVTPWRALSNAEHLGERVGKLLAGASTPYSMVHLVGHSAGSNLIHIIGRELRLANASAPKIQSTFLDAFCGYPDRCDYGVWSDWADNYFDAHPVIVSEGTETRRRLCHAANFDLSATYPILDEGVLDSAVSQARHAWPYKCYATSSATGALSSSAFNVNCLGSTAGNIGFGLSYFGSGATNLTTFFNDRNSAYAKGSLRTQVVGNAFSGPAAGACGAGTSGLSLAITGVGNAISSVNNSVNPGVLASGASCAAASFVAPVFGVGGVVARLLTCSRPTTQGASAPSGLKAATTLTATAPVTSWSVLNVNVPRRSNQIRFTVQFTQAVNAVFTAYVDDAQVYRTTQDLRGATTHDTGLVDIPTIERGARKISFRLDSIDGAEASAEVSSLVLSGASVCDLDLDADGSMTVARDGALLLRYLLGFRGTALVDGLGITDANAAQAIADYVGSAVQFDIFGRATPAPTATQDGLVLLRLMLGMPDDALLNGVGAPAGALFTTGTTVRGNVNTKCGTRF